MCRYRTGGPWRGVILEQMLAQADAGGGIDWQLSSDSTVNRVHLHGADLSRQVAVGLPSHTGDASNYRRQPVEPVDHAIGRFRGSLTTNLHTLVYGNGQPLVLEAGPGQYGDNRMPPLLMDRLRGAALWPRAGPDPARCAAGR